MCSHTETILIYFAYFYLWNETDWCKKVKVFKIEIRAIGYFDIVTIFSSCLDLLILILMDILRNLHVEANKFPWNLRIQGLCFSLSYINVFLPNAVNCS